ncbi:MAG TPA: LamG domain-containing protein [Planctomycetota bacterium]|nr:LamG domain-containing protein [Planctomycetota bacterium]
MRLRTALVIATMVLVRSSALPAQAEDPARRPVPDAVALKEQEVLIKGVFKAEYAKPSIGDRRDLAAKLGQQAAETKDSPAARYVLLRESRDLASEAADLGIAFKAIDAMAAEFRIAPLPMKLASAGIAAKGARTADDFRRLGASYLKVADEAFAAEEFDTALQAATRAATLARLAKDPTLAIRADQKTKEAGELRGRLEAVRKAREALAANPDHESSNALVGEYLCLIRGDWSAGVSFLSKGMEGRWRDLARKDLSQPTRPEEQVALADAWWEAAEREKGRLQESLRKRAVYWYETASPALAGVVQLRVQQRLAGLAPAWISTDLFAYWKMNEGEGGVMADSSGNGRNGKLVGATWTKGVTGAALHFDGALQKVTIDAGDVPVPWTVALWVCREESRNHTARLMDGRSSSLRLEQSLNTHQVGITKYAVVDHAFAYTAAPNTWVHLAWVGTATSVSLYANGTLAGTLDQTMPLSVDRLGSQDQMGLKGSLDEIRIYSRDLSGTEIEALYDHSRR